MSDAQTFAVEQRERERSNLLISWTGSLAWMSQLWTTANWPAYKTNHVLESVCAAREVK